MQPGATERRSLAIDSECLWLFYSALQFVSSTTNDDGTAAGLACGFPRRVDALMPRSYHGTRERQRDSK